MNNEAPVELSCELSNVRLLLLDVQALGLNPYKRL